MNSDLLASVIMPAYNHEAYVADAITSVLEQSYSAVELLISDDSSDDRTPEIIRQMADRHPDRITYVAGKTNRGTSARWSELLLRAQGHYIVPFASDDRLPAKAIEQRVRFLQDNPDLDVVVTDFDLIGGDGKLVSGDQKLNFVPQFKRLYDIDWKQLYAELLEGNFIPGGALCIGLSRICKTEVMQDALCPNLSDWDLWLRLAAKYRFGFLAQPTWQYRWHGGNLSTPGNPKNSQSQLLQQSLYVWTKQLLMPQSATQRAFTLNMVHQLSGKIHAVSSVPIIEPQPQAVTTSIVIVTYNSMGEIEPCLKSIVANTRLPYEIIVVDNVSTDGTQEYLKNLANVKVIQNTINNGFSKGTNQGIREATGAYIVMLNPDTMVTKGWDEQLIAHFKGDVGAVGPVSNYVAGLQKFELYCDERLTGAVDLNALQARLYRNNAGQGVETKLLIGFCLMTRRDVIEKNGMLDEDLFLGNDDLEFSWRLREAGYRLQVATDTFVYHKGQASFNTEPSAKTKRLVQESTDALYRKLVQHYTPDPVPSGEELWGIAWFRPSTERPKDEQLVSIVILAHNELEYTQKCVESIMIHTTVPYELILVDNGSTDGTPTYLNQLKGQFSAQSLSPDSAQNQLCRGVQIIRHDDNKGFAAGNNAGIAVAQGDYVLLMNNDVVVTPGWLRRMQACFEAHPEAGIVGPRSNNVSGPQQIAQVEYDPQNLSGLNRFAQNLAEVNADHAQRLLRVVGFCMLIKRAVIERIGGLDHRYGLGNFEDDDFSLRAALAGFESWMAQDAFVHHFGSRTFIGAKIDYRQSLQRNWEIFKQKWDQPSDLAYGSPYDVTQILRGGFDPERHYVPLPGASDGSPLEAESSAAMAPHFSNQGELNPEETVGSVPQVEGSRSQVTIVLSLDNTLKRVRRCIESLQRHTPPEFEVVMIDNGAAKTVRKWAKTAVKKDERLRVIDLARQAHVAHGLNQAVQASKADYVVWMHNDVQVFEGWYEAMTACWRIHPTTALVGPVATAGCDPRQCYRSVEVPDREYVTTSRQNLDINRYRYLPTPHLAGLMLCGRRQMFAQLGEIDTQFEDETFWIKDLCLRASLEGMSSMVAAGVLVQHHDQHISPKSNERTGKDQTSDGVRFIAKWRGIEIQSPTGQKLLVHKALESAKRLYQQDQMDPAIDTLLAGIGHVPEDLRLYLCLAQMLVDAEQYQQALAVLREMPAIDTTEQMQVLEGYCHEGLQQYDKAGEIAADILQRDPNHPAALNLKGVLAFHQGDRVTAQKLFAQTVELNPAFAEAYTNLGSLAWEQGDHEKGLTFFEDGFRMDATANASMRMYHMAIAASGQWERAARIFAESAHQFPHHKRIALLWIDTLVQQGSYEAAMTAIEATMATFGFDADFLAAAKAVRAKLGPMRLPKATAGRNRVSLCMIVKNEAEHLAACLYSLKPIVDEIIIADTGSEDQTQDIAEVFGARVYDFEWNSDFSAARNFSLAQAQGDWILVMDADEVIAPSDHAPLRQLLRRAKGKPGAFTITTRNYFDHANITGWIANQNRYPEQEKGSGWVPSRKVRLFVNDTRIQFENPVHELVEPSLQRCGINIKTCKIPVHHYGKLNATKIDTKGEAYMRMGEIKLAEKDGDLKALEELAMQALELGQHAKAIELWQRAIETKPDSAMAHLHMSSSYLQLEADEEAHEASAQALVLNPGLKEAVLNHSLSGLCVGDVPQTIRELETLLAQVPDYPPAIGVLATAYCMVDDTQKGLERLSQIKGMGYDCAAYLQKRAQRLMDVGRHTAAVKVLQTAVEGGYVNQGILSLLGTAYKGSGFKNAGGVSQLVSAV